jgi:hypothetical protein
MNQLIQATLATISLLLPLAAPAISLLPGSPPPWLDHWSFNSTNTLVTDNGYVPISLTNVDTSLLGNFYEATLDSDYPAWLQYNAIGHGTNLLRVDVGTVMFWFGPNWSSTNQGGTGPGEWSRLIEVGSFTTNAAYGWWSLYTDPEGENIYFSAQTNGTTATYLSVPISWNITNRWHHIALAYSATNSKFYLDGVLVTNGAPVSYWPGADVLSFGFFLGSDGEGLNQAHGMFDDLYTYDYPVDANSIGSVYSTEFIDYYGNIFNAANFVSAPSVPISTPVFTAVTGSGYLITNGPADCVTNLAVWITNVVATFTNGGVNLTFTIAGGSNGAPYDVFANGVLDFSTNTIHPWAWMGQGYHCTSYPLTNLPPGTVFVILGTPLDSDQDGLTDAYERLVSKTDPSKASTMGDGMLDGWKIVWGLNPLEDNAAQSPERLNYTYDPSGWLTAITGSRGESVGLDREGNVKSNSQ